MLTFVEKNISMKKQDAVQRDSNGFSPAVKWWLFIGVVMIFFQVVLGGITRLTDSGLSITEWAVIQGVLPPMNEQAWQEAFEAYKQAAARQYETLHREMDLRAFKAIYFWEYLHRLWARSMGMVFLIPFLWFWYKGKISRGLMKRLGVVILLASLAAIFGWIMVKSGLNDDKRTWVSAYKLVVHLLIATALYSYLFWIWRMYGREISVSRPANPAYRLYRLGLVLLFVQIALGGLMAGMRAALVFPFFPAISHGQSLFALLAQQTQHGIDLRNFVDYEPAIWIKALVQLLHRATAWLLAAVLLAAVWKSWKLPSYKERNIHAKMLISMLTLQLLLGIFTVIHSFGRVPVDLAAMHQAGALLLLGLVLYILSDLRTQRAV